MHTAPKIARWDYHATHINQLLTLATVEEKKAAQILRATAERWRGYMAGQRASHN
jgi:heparosan-N-sulfate-glucuronate 5-epimerase